MRKILIAAVILVLVYFFFHMRRVDDVSAIANEAIAQLDQGNLGAGLEALKKLDSYSAHKDLQPKIAQAKDRFYERVRDDVLKMAKDKQYNASEDYNFFGAVPLLADLKPQPPWTTEFFDQLAEIALSQDLYFLQVKDREQQRIGKELYAVLVGVPTMSPKLKERVQFACDQCGLRWYHDYLDFDSRVKMEIRNGKPFYYK